MPHPYKTPVEITIQHNSPSVLKIGDGKAKLLTEWFIKLNVLFHFFMNVI
jgi:hypothetical protein